MKNKKPQDKPLQKYFLWFAILEVVVIFALGWLFLLQNQWYTISEYDEQQHQVVVNELSQKEQQLEDSQALEQEFQGLNDERYGYAQRVLPIGLEPTEMISRLEYLGQQANIEISSVDVVRGGDTTTIEQKPKPQSGDDGEKGNGAPEFSQSFVRTGTITMNVNLQKAGYAELKNFLDALESFTPVLDLQTLQYASNTKTFALQLRTYYIDPEAL